MGSNKGVVQVGSCPGAEGGRAASFTDVNPRADHIACPENLEEQREI